MALWTPANLTTVTLEGWYRVHDPAAILADGSDISTTGSVNTWADQSGHSRTLTKEGSPTYDSNGLSSGHPAVMFSFAGFRTAAGAAYPSSAVIGAITIGTTTSTGRVSSLNASAATDFGTSGAIPIFQNGSSLQYYRNGSTATVTHTTGTTVAIFEGVPLSTTTADIGLNTVLSGTPNTIAGFTADRMGLFAESDSGAGNPSGSCAEYILWAGVVSTGERQQLEGYIAWNNGQQTLLPGGHPYASAAPTTGGGGSVGQAAGVGAATAIGASTAASVGASAGIGAATGIGASTAAAVGSAAGIGAATAVGIGVTAGDGSSAGIGSATAVGASTAAAIGNAAGVGAATAIGASTAAAVGAAAGTGAAAATSFTGNIGTASGIGAAAAVGASIAAAVGVATGIGAAAATSGSETPSDPPSTASGGSGFATGPYTGPFRRRKKKKTEDEELDELAELLRAAPKAAPAIYKPIVYQGPLAAIFYEPIATIEQRRTTPAVNEIMARAKAQRREEDDEETLLKLLEAHRLEIVKELQDLLMLL